MKKKAPTFKFDKEIEEFLDHELTDYIDPHKIQPVPFEFLPKTEIVNLGFPPERLTAVRNKAAIEEISNHNYIRRPVEESVASR